MAEPSVGTIERAKLLPVLTSLPAAIPPLETDTTHEQTDELTVQAQKAYTFLGTHEETLPLLGLYAETLEASDSALQTVRTALSELEGAQLIVEVARTNLAKQVKLFLIAASEIQQTGRATVSHFGVYKTFHSVDEIQQEMARIKQDFDTVNTLPKTYQAFKEQGLAVMDKYIFDPRNAEAIIGKEAKTLILEYPDIFQNSLQTKRITQEQYEEEVKNHPKRRGIAELLTDEQIIPKEQERLQGSPFTIDTQQILPYKIAEIRRTGTSREEYLKKHQILKPGESLPEVVIVHIPDETALRWNHDTYQQLFVDYWFQLDPKDRPTVVFYADGFKPHLSDKDMYEGFLWASTPDQLRNVMALSKELTYLKNKPEDFTPQALAPRQEKQYDTSFDLREWEHKTADTYKSLKHILARIEGRDTIFNNFLRERYTTSLFNVDVDVDANGNVSFKKTEKNDLRPVREIKTVLDLGPGEGRIAGMLARLGYKILGLDISDELLKRAKERVREEGEGLRGEREDNTLSYPILQRLKEEGVVRQDIILDDEQILHNFLTAKGNFFQLDHDLNHLLAKWNEHFPGIDIYDFFNVSSDRRPYAFDASKGTMFSDAGFDVAMFNWHTFCEIGDRENQKDVLRQILNVLWPGGELIIEIPDRTVEPYRSSIDKYHKTHPDTLYGTHQETYENGEKYSPRYFPDRNEIVLLLQSVGFEINAEQDVESYFIESTDPTTGKKKLEVKELVIHARKSKASEILD